MFRINKAHLRIAGALYFGNGGRFLLGLCALIILTPTATSNDSAASTAAGGIQLIKENRISIAKERLTISKDRITVEYEFLNESNRDIPTEVAFPVPSYSLIIEDPGGPRSFDDFRVWIDGREVKYQTEIKAIVNNIDYSDILRKLGIDITTFGHMNPHDWTSDDFKKLSSSQQMQLEKLGLFNPNPSWEVQKTYHWHQLFSKQKIVRVRHEYKPVIGFSKVPAEWFDPLRRNQLEALKRQNTEKPLSETDWTNQYLLEFYRTIDAGCIDPGVQMSLSEYTAESRTHFLMWIDYILTTANNWKIPIHEFELLVESPQPVADRGQARFGDWYVSFCWNGVVTRIDSNHFLVRSTNFVPKQELKVLFIQNRKVAVLSD